MSFAFRILQRLLLAALVSASWVNYSLPTAAQSLVPIAPPIYTVSLPESANAAPQSAPTLPPSIGPLRPRGPLARLVRNENDSGGLPPYALADQAGTIQRYVEPVPTVDLAPYVGSIVSVRHDTGKFLLATQLELPKLAVGRLDSVEHPASSHHANGQSVDIAAFVDDSGTQIELIDGATESGDEIPEGRSVLAPASADDSVSGRSMSPAGRTELNLETLPEGGPVFSDGVSPYIEPDGSVFPGEVVYETNEFGEPVQQALPYYQDGVSFDDFGASGGLIDRAFNSPNCRYFGDAEFMLMRLHLTESVAGKLSEQYKFSPRFIIGFEGGDISDGRIRLWMYDHRTPILEAGGGSVTFELEVLDIEATQRFQIRRSDIIVGAGMRLAQIIIGDDEGAEVGTDLMGLTVAADARTHLCNLDHGAFSWIYGARLSLLGGDWGGDFGHELVEIPSQDDNFVVNELHAGVEYAFRFENIDLQARLSFEMQTWLSDVFARSSQADSIGLLGPGVHIGAQF